MCEVIEVVDGSFVFVQGDRNGLCVFVGCQRSANSGWSRTVIFLVVFVDLCLTLCSLFVDFRFVLYALFCALLSLLVSFCIG